MAGSIIIFGGNKDSRKNETIRTVSKSVKNVIAWGDLRKNPDIKIVEIPDDKKSIGIAETREAIKYLAERPFSGKNKFIVINDAHAMTREAQNSLLKTLEEPPIYGNIILLTKTLNDLLDTVVSRCKITQIKKEKFEITPENKNSYMTLVRLDPGTRLDWAGETSKEEKEDVLQILENWVAEAREMMLDSPSAISLKNIKLIGAIKKDLENTNVSTRLALENLVLNLD